MIDDTDQQLRVQTRIVASASASENEAIWWRCRPAFN
jgi:hypothetical protein